jgi:GTP-binding protein EngB required for normal cell division
MLVHCSIRTSFKVATGALSISTLAATDKFEIRVALLGYVSVGKTTVLNAIFRDKFSEVAMKRTTAGINFFRVINADAELSAGQTSPTLRSAMKSATKAKKAAETLREIQAMNRKLRLFGTIEEKWFDIELDDGEPLCEMRDDTSLVLVDIPGINEAETNNIYSKYVDEHWSEFDCVVVVMDARQGVNTDQQVNLLKLVQRNLGTKKRMPTIILFNKVDDPDDAEQANLVREAQTKVSQLFTVPFGEKTSRRATKKPKLDSKTDPIFLATSANHAFFYRTASLITYSQFKAKFGQEIIECIGKLEVGRHHWKSLTLEKKYRAVYNAVCKDSDYKERLEATNFDKFLKALSLSVGGEEEQRKLLEAQVDVAIRSMGNTHITVPILQSVYNKSTVLGKSVNPLQMAFWSHYNAKKRQALTDLENKFNVERLGDIADLLSTYYTFMKEVDWNEEKVKLREETCGLVREQVGVIVNKQDIDHALKALEIVNTKFTCSPCRIREKQLPRNFAPAQGWEQLSVHGWNAIFRSILLVSARKDFADSFAQEMVLIGQLNDKFASRLGSSNGCLCNQCKPVGYHYHLNNAYQMCSKCHASSHRGCEKYLPMNKWDVKYSAGNFNVVIPPGGLAIPASVSDKKHWGHVACKCCTLLEGLRGDYETGRTPV